MNAFCEFYYSLFFPAYLCKHIFETLQIDFLKGYFDILFKFFNSTC